MKKLKLILLISLIVSLNSCKTLFTESIRKTVQRTNLDRIEKVQFYNDREIEIVYKTSEAKDIVEGGKVKFKAGYYYYFIKFPKHTKAQAKHIDNERLKVFFEVGEDRYLIFGDSGNDKDEYYQLYGNDLGDGFYVNFEGKKFKVINGGQALLKIKKNYKEKTITDKRKVKGVKVK